MARVEHVEIAIDLDNGGLIKGVRGSTRALNQLEKSLKGTGAAYDSAHKKSRNFVAGMRDWIVILGQARNAFNQIRFVTTDWMTSLVRVNAEVERMTYLMRGFSSATSEAERIKEANDLVSQLFDIAKRAPFEINAISDSFVKMKSVGIDPLDGSMQSLLDAVAQFGGDSDVLKRASIAIQQMAGKGVISMEELRQQMGEAVPRSIELMARSLGVSYGELVKQISTGTVEATHALGAMFGEFERTFGGAAERLMQSFNGQMAKMHTNAKLLFTQSEGMRDFFDLIKDSLRDFNVFLEGDQAAIWASRLGDALSDAASGARRLLEIMYQYRDEIINIARVLTLYFGVRLTVGVIGGLAAAFGGLIGTIRTVGAVMTGSLAVGAASSAAKMSLLGGFLVGVRNGVTSLARAMVGLIGGFRTLQGMSIAAMWDRGSAALSSFLGIASRGVGILGALALALGVVANKMGIFVSNRQQLENIANPNNLFTSQEDVDESLASLREAEGRVDQTQNKMGKLRQELAQLRQETIEGLNFAQRAARAANAERLNFLLETEQESLDRFKQLYDAAYAEYERKSERFRDQQIERQKQDIVYGIEKEVRNISQEYDQRRIDLIEESFDTEEEALQAKKDALNDFYHDSINTWELFIAESKVGLEGMTAEQRAALEQAVAYANEQILRLRKAWRAGLEDLDLSIVTVDSPGSGGGGGVDKVGRAVERFAEEAEKIKNETDNALQRLTDPLAFEMPKAVESMEQRLKKIIDGLPAGSAAVARLTAEMKKLVQQTKELEVMKLVIDLKEGTKEITRGLMGARQARREAYNEEVQRLQNMRAVLIEQGLWRENYEIALQERLKAIREQFVSESPMGEFANQWKNYFDDIENIAVDAIEGISQALADMVTEGKASLEDLARSTLNAFLQASFNAAISMAAMGIQSAFAPTAPATVAHSGAIAGQGGGRRRHMSMEAFGMAPRFHTGGIAGNEMPAIVQKGEGIFTEGQMKAIGAGMSKTPNIKMQIINESGVPVQAEQRGARMNVDTMVLDIVLKAANRPGSFRDSLKGSLK